MKYYLIFLTALLIIGCSSESEFNDSVFIPDKQYPDLPAYTELGFNTFGANFERTVFIYTEDIMPFKVSADSLGLALIFQGIIGGYYPYEMMILKIVIPDFLTRTYQDLLVYNNSIIDLNDPAIKVQIIDHEIPKNPEMLEGELHVRGARTLFVDDQEQQVVLSGTFNLRYTLDGVPSQLSEGRFDVGVCNENFFVLNMSE